MSSDDLKPVASESDSSASAGTDDDALILWMLSLTPTQRLEAAQDFVDSLAEIKKGKFIEES